MTLSTSGERIFVESIAKIIPLVQKKHTFTYVNYIQYRLRHILALLKPDPDLVTSVASAVCATVFKVHYFFFFCLLLLLNIIAYCHQLISLHDLIGCIIT